MILIVLVDAALPGLRAAAAPVRLIPVTSALVDVARLHLNLGAVLRAPPLDVARRELNAVAVPRVPQMDAAPLGLNAAVAPSARPADVDAAVQSAPVF